MALVRAKSFGVGPHGGKVREGVIFEHEGALGSWMELVGEVSSPPAVPSTIAPAQAAEAPQTEIQSEAASEEPAESKRQLRNRKSAPKEAEE
jgi:hypothetical protein